ncbi:MAG TPA: hypothetical protein VI248_22775, partial [Kineosporiaceae bacterium]
MRKEMSPMPVRRFRIRKSVIAAIAATGAVAAIGLAVQQTAMAGTSGEVVNAPGVQASTSQLRGVNWADTRDNFVNGVLYPSGLGASDTYASAATTANRVVGQLYTLTGGNTVRMPINEPTV